MSEKNCFLRKKESSNRNDTDQSEPPSFVPLRLRLGPFLQTSQPSVIQWRARSLQCPSAPLYTPLYTRIAAHLCLAGWLAHRQSIQSRESESRHLSAATYLMCHCSCSRASSSPPIVWGMIEERLGAGPFFLHQQRIVCRSQGRRRRHRYR